MTRMTDNEELRHDWAENEAVEGVVNRVLSWQAGAPAETVREELVSGLEKIGETVPEEWLAETTERISNADPAQK